MIHIAVTNESTVLTDRQAVSDMVAACTMQLSNHVAPAYNLRPFQVQFYPDPTVLPENVMKLIILDEADVDGALGYHDDETYPAGKVFAKTILDNGGTVSIGPNAISSCLSHELIEMVVDPKANLWAQRNDSVLQAYEACDPVEDSAYFIRVRRGVEVAVSNFVLPAYYDDTPEVPVFDHLRLLIEPWTMSQGGYMILLDPKDGSGSPYQVFGKEVPPWVEAMKKAKMSRFAKR